MSATSGITLSTTPNAAGQAISANSSLFGALGVFVTFSVLYIPLRAGDIFAVDGAHRCLEVYRRQTLFFHGSNHMLYPAWVFLWERFIGVLGFKAASPIAFFHLVEVMNCLAGAACLAIFFWIAKQVARDWRVVLAATIGFGMSKAFFEQATNANEPMVGLLWSFVAIALAILPFRLRSDWPLLASGFCFALAMASYQSMVFLAPAAVVLAWRARAPRAQYAARRRLIIRALSLLLAGGLAGCAIVYGSAAWANANRGPAPAVQNLVRIEGERTWLGVTPGKALNVPIGLVQNIFPVLKDYRGIRALRRGPAIPLLRIGLILSATLAFVTFCAIKIWRQRDRLSLPQRTAVLASSTGLAFTLIPIFIFDPNYNKLWLQPLACLALLIIVALTGGWKRARSERLLRAVALLMLFAGLIANVTWILHNHDIRDDVFVQEASDLAGIIRQNDLLIGEWNRVSILYGELSQGRRYIDFVSDAAQDGGGAVDVVRQAVSQTEQRGGNVYFLGVLDDSKQIWDGFLGSRCGIPFSTMDEYRRHSTIVAAFPDGNAQVVLRRLT